MASLRLFLFSGKNYFPALEIIYAGYGNGRCRPFMIKMPPVGGERMRRARTYGSCRRMANAILP